MKVTFSVLVAGLSGKSGDVVASRWKGIPFFRQRVVPANPQSTAQMAQRNRNTTKVWMWQEQLPLQRQAWEAFVQGQALSAFNGFVGANKVDPMADTGLILSPFNPDVDPVADFAFTDATGQIIQLDWTDPSIANSEVLAYVMLQDPLPAGKMSRDDFPSIPDLQTGQEDADTAVWLSDQVDTAGDYLCYAALYDPTVNVGKINGVNGISKSFFQKLTVA